MSGLAKIDVGVSDLNRIEFGIYAARQAQAEVQVIEK